MIPAMVSVKLLAVKMRASDGVSVGIMRYF
jgi:hypothetical protein